MNIVISQPECFSEKGQKSNQEDTLFPQLGKSTKETRVFLVCDGMGGHEHGEVASSCVAETIGKLTAGIPLCTAAKMRNTFEKALQQAYCNLDELDNSVTEKKMGTTLTFLAICSDGVLIAHIGDSRVYQMRPGKGIIFQTRDHSLVNELIAAGELSEEEAKTFPQRNVITRAIQPHQEYPAKATYYVQTDIRKGDLFFLCSDGVVEQLDNKDLCELLLRDNNLNERKTNVRKECEARGTHDNNTAYLIEVYETGTSSDVVLKQCTESCTLSPDTQQISKESKIPRFTIIILSILIVAILTIIILFMSSHGKQHKYEEVKNTEQVQGTIHRHKN